MSFQGIQSALHTLIQQRQCFYIAHEADVRGKLAIDRASDPPPDLAIEIDIASSSINRMAIYAALGIPEVWRFDGTVLRFFQRQGDDYQAMSHSPTFPQIQPADLLRFVAMTETTDDTTIIRAFRQWLRQYCEP